MGFKKKVILGSIWISMLRLLSRSISIVKTIIIARILGPFELGTFAISSITLALLETLSETGINVTLLQEDENGDLLNSAWIVSILRGFLISGILILLSFLLPPFFNNSDLSGLLILTSIIPIIKGFLNPSIIKLQKQMLYKKDFQIRSFLYVIDTVVSMAFAFILKNSYCIVIGQIVYAVFELLISWLKFKPHPKWIFSKNKFREIIGNGKWVTMSGIFEYLFYNIDDLVIGKLLGSYSLGIYNTVYRIAIVPITESGEIISKVTLPVLLKIEYDKERLYKAFRKVTSLMMFFLVPLTIVAIIFADRIIFLLLGREWMSAVPVLRILLVHGCLRAISGYTAVLFIAVKKQIFTSWVTLASMAVMLITVIPLVKSFGLLGGGLASFFGTLASIPVMYAGVRKIFNKYEKS